MTNYIKDIHTFIKHDVRKNAWLTYKEFAVYVRKASRKLPGDLHYSTTFDVANISVQPEHQGKGIFTNWLNQLEKEAKELEMDAIYVENLLNPRLADFLDRCGYTKMGDERCPSYFLRIT